MSLISCGISYIRENGFRAGLNRIWQICYRKSFRRYPYPILKLTKVASIIHPRWHKKPLVHKWIDPSEVRFESVRAGVTVYGRPVGGDWDLDRKPIKENVIYRGLHQYLNSGDPTLYERVDPKSTDRHSVVDGSIPAVDDLIESIQSGVKLPNITDGRKSNTVPAKLDSPTIDIGRDDEYIWHKRGRHRLFLAKLLELDRIPVIIGRVHTLSSYINRQIDYFNLPK